jgi:hypothetical protein
MPRSKAPALQYLLIDEPIPQAKPGAKREKLFEILAGMKVGTLGVEINRKEKSARNYVYRFRKVYGRDLRFIIRTIRPNWCRIWRVR